jgi:hypothetical protein
VPYTPSELYAWQSALEEREEQVLASLKRAHEAERTALQARARAVESLRHARRARRAARLAACWAGVAIAAAIYTGVHP